MKPEAAGWAQDAVRGWVRVYTAGLPQDAREGRRAEIESDLWEQERDALLAGGRRVQTIKETWGRLLCGMPADLSWRLGHSAGIERGMGGIAFTALVLAGFLLGFLLPGKPDVSATAPEMQEYFAARGGVIFLGYGLMGLGVLSFIPFVGSLRSALRGARKDERWVPSIAYTSGLLGGALILAAFALTGAGAVLAMKGLGPQTLDTLYPLGGLTFHRLLSAALAVFAGSAAIAALRGRGLPAWWGTMSGMVAALIAIEAAGGFTGFMAQLVFLVWIILTNVLLNNGDRSRRESA